MAPLIMSDSAQGVLRPSEAHTTPKRSIDCQPSPMTPMSMDQKEGEPASRLRGGCIPCGVRIFFTLQITPSTISLNPLFAG